VPGLARALRETGRADEARSLLTAKLDAGGLDAATERAMTLELGRTLLELEDVAGGDRLLREVSKGATDETGAEAQFSLGASLQARGALKDADGAFYKLLLLYPVKRFHAEARFRLGQINEKLGDYPRAREFYAELVRENPDHPLAPKARERLDVIGP